MKTLLGFHVASLDGTNGEAYRLTSHCGEVYTLCRMLTTDPTVMSVRRDESGRFPILNTRSDRFTDRGGVLRLLGR